MIPVRCSPHRSHVAIHYGYVLSNPKLQTTFAPQDPDASDEDTHALLTRQFMAFSAALVDEAPLVRTAAVKGVCDVLNLYWEIIPSATTAG